MKFRINTKPTVAAEHRADAQFFRREAKRFERTMRPGQAAAARRNAEASEQMAKEVEADNTIHLCINVATVYWLG